MNVIITGSTSGIGAATARLFASKGARVVVTGRNEERGDAVVAEISAAGGDAVFVPSDLQAGPDELRATAAAWAGALDGRVDVLVHNAAVVPVFDTPGLPDAELDAALAINVRAPHVLTAALAPAMAERGSGSIVVIGSWMASVGHPFVGLYAATKAAEIQLARSWAAEFGPRGVRVNSVSPGVTRTPVNDGADGSAEMVAATPPRVPVQPEDIAAAVVWVASDDARFVYGVDVPVDGGILTTRVAATNV